MLPWSPPLLVTLLLLAVAACGDRSADPSGGGGRKVERAPVHGYEVVRSFPHDRGAYTQGLVIVDGTLYEGTGKHGESSVRIVDLESGRVLKKRDLDARYFGEGIAVRAGLLVQLTWKAREARVHDRESLRYLYSYEYSGEGWGLTWTGTEFVMSDGTATLRFLDETFQEKRRVRVKDGIVPVRDLNELEWIEGEVWANVWQSERIARIDPATGRVKSWIDLEGILGDHRVRDPNDEVLNGIAWDADTGKVYVTGKRWPRLYEIRVVE